MEVTQIIIAIFTLTANFAVGLLTLWFKKTDIRIAEIEHQVASVRLNYLDRFDDIKSNMNLNHLDLIQRITKLETLFTK